jgi:hypothetical protein
MAKYPRILKQLLKYQLWMILFLIHKIKLIKTTLSLLNGINIMNLVLAIIG